MTDRARLAAYRKQVRKTLRALSDHALAYQNTIVIGGIDRIEVDRELARRRAIKEAS